MIKVTKGDLREVVRDVLTAKFVENDQEYLEEVLDEIIDQIESLEEDVTDYLDDE